MTVGIDEVGRGCLAGPMVIGLTSLDQPIYGLNDSKLISKNKRIKISSDIFLLAEAISLGWVWPNEIDELGLTDATTLAIKRALSQLSIEPSEIIIDGNYNYLPGDNRVKVIIGADKTIKSVSAASIIAKVCRDHYMFLASQYYPQYGFINNVGYGTAKHLAAIKKHGSTIIHRKSFAPINKTI